MEKQEQRDLFMAMDRGDGEACSRLIKEGLLDPNKREGYIQSPLHDAAYDGHADVCRALLAAKAKPNQKERELRRTPLHLGVESGNADVCRVLLEGGADPNLVDKEGMNSFHAAAYGRKAEICQMLLEHGADPKATTKDGDPLGKGPMYWALRGVRGPVDAENLAKLYETIDVLLNYGISPEEGLAGTEPALLFAARYGHLPLARRLLEAGANPDVADADGTTALHLAVDERSEAMCELLITMGANPSAMNSDWIKPCDAAKSLELHDLAAYLRAAVNGGSSNAEHVANRTSALVKKWHGKISWDDGLFFDENLGLGLFETVQAGNLEASKELVADGAIPVMKDSNGRTPLHIAAMRGDSAICLMLARAGSGVWVEDHEGWLPIDYAAGGGNPPPNEPLRDDEAHAATCIVLLRFRGALKSRRGGRFTPLHAAAMSGLPAVCETLLWAEEDPTAQDGEGFAPLHYAAQSHEPSREVFRILLQSGANPNAKSEDGSTCLHAAAESGSSESCDLLLKSGADLMARDGNGRTPEERALEGGHSEVAAYLRAALEKPLLGKSVKSSPRKAEKRGSGGGL